ncbi:MAG: restriction endonuclease subunit S [Dehalococcoidia bacterium]
MRSFTLAHEQQTKTGELGQIMQPTSVGLDMDRAWPQAVLGELIQCGDAHLQTGPFGTALKAAEYASVGVPLISVREIRDGYLEVGEGTPRVSAKTVERLSKFVLEAGDIVFGRKGGIDRNAVVKSAQEGWFLGSDGIRLRLSKNHDSRFFSYRMRSPATRAWLTQNSEGTTMPSLNQEILSRVPVVVPPLPEQRAIAHILGTLDDKIELNRRMNETLEAMARAIFKSWFIDFDPVRAKSEGRDTGLPPHIANLFPDSFEDSELGQIPAGWEVAPLHKFATLQTKAIQPRDEPGRLWEHYSIPAFDEGRRPSKELGATIKSGKYLVPQGAVLMSKLNPQFPRVWLADVSDQDSAICSTEFLPFIPKSTKFLPFLYELARSDLFQNEIINRATGSTGSRQRVRPKDVGEISIALPPAELLDCFSRLAGAVNQRILINIRISASVEKIRDTLLPKLITGELRTSDAAELLDSTA